MYAEYSRSYYYFENAYEFIAEDLEWYIDQHTDTIYFKAPSGVDMNKARITVPTLETLINIEGDKENKAENITFENIIFECTTWTLPGEEGLVGAQACQYTLTTTLENKTTVYHIPAGFYATYADNLLVKGCTFRKMGAMGLDYYEGVTNSDIFENEVYDIAATGISIAKFVQDEKTEYHTAYNPSDKREITKNINVINNKVHHIGTEYEGAVGIAAGYLFDMPTDPAAVEITDYVKANGLEAALAKYSNITDADDVAMIKTFYDMFVEKAPFEKFVETLAAMKSVNTH